MVRYRDALDSRSGTVRRSQIGELGQQIGVGPHFVPFHLSVCENSHEGVTGVIGQRPAIAREGRRARGVIGQDFRQQCPRYPRCELCGKVGDGVNQAAGLISATASIPSLNFIPLTTFGNWF
jgi:hypothetical protein